MKRTMIPNDLLALSEELIQQIPLNPLDGKPWGPVEALRFMLRACSIPVVEMTSAEEKAFYLMMGYSQGETCQRVRLKRGVKTKGTQK